MNLRPLLALSMLRLRLNRTYLIFQLIIDIAMPVGYALLVSRSGSGIAPSRLATGAFIVCATLSVMRFPADIILTERKFGVRNLLFVSGVSRGDYLTANLFSTFYFALFPVTALVLTSFVLGVPLPPYPAYWLVLGLLLVSLHGFALILGSSFNAMGPFAMVTNLIVLVTAAVCPVYFPLSRVPELIRPAVEYLPGSLAAELGQTAGRMGDLDPSRLAMLFVWAFAAVIVGYAILPWRQDG